MTSSRDHSQESGPSLRLEPTTDQSQSEYRLKIDAAPDRRIVALVRLLARLAAEADFRDDSNERQGHP